jgi:SAM-dependent methyltransferase
MANTITPTIPTYPPSSCPVCGFQRSYPYLTVDGTPLWGCYNCGCVFAYHPNLKSILDAYYGKTYADDRGHGGEKGIDRCKERTYSLYLNSLAKTKNGKPRRLLDVGCSAGLGLLTAKKLGFAVTGVEASPESVRMAKKLLPDADIFPGTILDHPFAPESFDVIILLDTAEHFQNPGAELSACASLLSPGGDLIILTPNIASLSLKISPHLWPHLVIEHSILYHPRALRKFMMDKGLLVVKGGFGRKKFNLEMMAHHIKLNMGTPLARFLLKLFSLLPEKLRQLPFTFNFGEFYAYFKKPIA